MNANNAKSMKLPTAKQIIQRLEKERSQRLKSKGSSKRTREKDSTNNQSISISLSIENPADLSVDSEKNSKGSSSSFFRLLLKKLCKWDCFSEPGEKPNSDDDCQL
ncbi:unnamed protein product [Blepharisma stoltei]|uniref:Uncharacterized protein n=1 Tax=Blepharisma stoltei TaxID=1481888 RepID=A0AAU9KAJ9_9CILI|nr:unnamed protein product [Blepharisma stoltei]